MFSEDNNEPLYTNGVQTLWDDLFEHLEDEYDEEYEDCESDLQRTGDYAYYDLDDNEGLVIHDKPLTPEDDLAWHWAQCWEAARQDALDEWQDLVDRKFNKAFLFAERLRLMTHQEQCALAEQIGWSPAKTINAINRIQRIITDTIYPEGRPH